MISFAFFALSPVLPAHANIINEGGEAVRLRFIKSNGRDTSTVLYPNQTIGLPQDAKEVKVEPFVSVRGDEEVSVKVIERDGVEKIISKYYESALIGVEQEVAVVVANPEIKNLSNVAVQIVVKRGRRSDLKRILYPGGTMALPDDALQVNVPREGRLWGDERIEVEVTTRNGTVHLIGSAGGRANLRDEEKEVALPSLIPK